MKKVLSIGVILFIAISVAKAQEEKVFGPRAGSYVVSFSADPFLEYFGNFFGKDDFNYAPWVEFANNYDLIGKYFVSDFTAVRAGIHLDYDSETSYFGAEDENKLKESESSIGIALGLEKRLGQNRFVGYYGPSIGIGYSSGSDVYSYDEDPADGTLLKRKYGSDLSFSLGAFGGVEYYICSQFAIGTEIGFGFNFYTEGKGMMEYQGQDDTETGSKSSGISFGFNNSPAQLAPYGSLILSFSF